MPFVATLFRVIIYGDLTMDATYRVVIRGVKEEFTKDQVVSQLAALFKVTEEQIQSKFSTGSFVVKKGIDLQATEKYRTVLEQRGCVCLIEVEDALEAVTAKYNSSEQTNLQQPVVPPLGNASSQVKEASHTSTLDNKLPLSFVNRIRLMGAKEWSIAASVAIVAVIVGFSVLSHKHQDNFDATNDTMGLQGSLKGYVYENDGKTKARLSSIRLVNTLNEPRKMSYIQMDIGELKDPASWRWDDIQTGEDMKLPLNVVLQPREEKYIDLSDEFVSKFPKIGGNHFLYFRIYDTKGGYWPFASNLIGKPLDYTNYHTATTKMDEIPSKENSQTSAGSDPAEQYANDVAAHLEQQLSPACQIYPSTIRDIGRSGMPGNIRIKQVDSVVSGIGRSCFR